MSLGTSLPQVLQVIITELIGNAGALCTCTCTHFMYTTHLYFCAPTKSRGPAVLPRNPPDLRGAGALIEGLYKPAIALLHKAVRTYIHCHDLWIDFP